MAAQPINTRAALIEARNLAYDANYRNDRAGLQSAIEAMQALLKTGEEAAYINYYLSWSYWLLAASQVQANQPKEAMDSGTHAVEHARAAIAVRDADPELHSMLVNALVVVAILDRSRIPAISAELTAARRRALELGPRNPRVLLMDTGMIFNRSPQAGGDGREEGLARSKEAIRAFEAEAGEKAVDPLAPRWGYALAYGWMGTLYLRMSPPQKDNAREAAEIALRMRPDFWWAREQVVPLTKN